MINRERMINNFIEMARISSPSLKEREMADYVKKQLQDLGMEVFEDGAGEKEGGNAGNIIGILRNLGKKRILLSAHMDTVLPCDKVNPIIENGIIKSDGTTVLGGDDKAGIANIIEAIRTIKENNLDHPEIIVVFSIAEEIGLLGAKNFDIEKYSPNYTFVLDSSGKPGIGIIQTPFSAKGKMKIIGKPAHAGIAPENGINALTVAAHAITKIKLGRIDSETTSNIGVVRGGEAVNIVMPEVTLQYEARSFSGEKLDNLLTETDRVFKEMCKEFGAEFENGVTKGYSGYRLEDSEEILNIFRKACAQVEVECVTKPTGGGSDSNIYNEKGYKALTIGIGMTKVHTKDEYIEIEDMVKTANLVVEILKEMA
ncbi:M20/M25/M40 family metallo-hydrolase [Fusobacterium sp.]|uniref:M20/M25/M40 family metallo-hydrolase n=1 Tax=Fusobacterium sp. TaxID=68766 RepID=UPI0025BB8654|nr:M20/M25/M40 family metallo-hydrolase [Fusobacterium sp.]